jgi:hypothetical protein
MEILLQRLADLEQRVARIEVQENHNFSAIGIIANNTVYTGTIYVPLITPLTSTSYDGNDTVITGTTHTVNAVSVFGVPATAKAINIYARILFASENVNSRMNFSCNNNLNITMQSNQTGGGFIYSNGIVCLNISGEFTLFVLGSQNATSVIIQVTGYFI